MQRHCNWRRNMQHRHFRLRAASQRLLQLGAKSDCVSQESLGECRVRYHFVCKVPREIAARELDAYLVCVCVCVYACWMYVCMYVCMHACVCVCVCVCMYIYTCCKRLQSAPLPPACDTAAPHSLTGCSSVAAPIVAPSAAWSSRTNSTRSPALALSYRSARQRLTVDRSTVSR